MEKNCIVRMNRVISLSNGSLTALLILVLTGHSFAAQPVEKTSQGYQQGGLNIGYTQPGTEVVFDKRKIRVSPEGIYLLGFHRDSKPEHELVLTYPDGRVEKRKLMVAKREYNIQRIDGLPKRKVSPSKKDMQRIRAEQKKINAARTIDEPRIDFTRGFIWPVLGPISGVYGSQRILNGKPRNPHYGVDIARPTGTPVVAPAPGKITLAEPDLFFSGGTMAIDHGHGLTSWFLHLSKIDVKVGDYVEQGEKVAEIGSTGRVTGPHLDWRMNLFKRRIDPQLLVPPMPETY